MSITQNNKIRRITDSTLVIGADIAKKVHVARACDVRGVELGSPLTFTTEGVDSRGCWDGYVRSCWTTAVTTWFSELNRRVITG